MFSSKKILFPHHGVLTGDMLREIRRLSEAALQNIYGDLSDGILAGLSVREEGEDIIFSPGCVKYQDKFYFSEEEISLKNYAGEVGADSTKYALTLKKAEDRSYRGLIDSRLYPVLTSTPAKNEPILCEVTGDVILHDLSLPKLNMQSGDTISKIADDFVKKFIESNSYVSMLQTPWSAPLTPSFHPLITTAVKDMLMFKSREGLSPADISLLLHLSNNLTVSLEGLRTYINVNLKENSLLENMSRRDILKKLAEAIKAPLPIYQAEYVNKERDEEKNQSTINSIMIKDNAFSDM